MIPFDFEVSLQLLRRWFSCMNKFLIDTLLGPVVRRPDSAIHRIAIFSTFVKCLKNCETTDIDDTRNIKNI
jgi:hypothetical protein